VRTRVGDGKTLLFHRELLNPKREFDIDHINKNGLDNRRCNLRIVTISQNRLHRTQKVGKSGFIGVKKNAHGNKWTARIKRNGKDLSFGSFDTAEHAAAARKRMLAGTYYDITPLP